MINRREALVGAMATICGGVAAFDLRASALQSSGDATAKPQDSAQSQTEKRLAAEIPELQTREYSEMGVPVFLACEDLVGRAPRVPVKLTEFNKGFSQEFLRSAQAWETLQPDPSDMDIGKVIEVLANRDFASGASEPMPISSNPTFGGRTAALTQAFAQNPIIRAVNFHNTPKISAARFEQQIAGYSRSFSPVSEEDLVNYLITGEWRKPKPGLIVSVFEGYRNSYEVLVPILEKYGFIGWFSMITEFLKSPVPQQRDFAEHHEIDMATHEYPDGRYALTWDELREIDRKHVIVSHSRTHTLLSTLDPEAQRSEVVGSQEDFKKYLGHPVRMFVSLTGPAYGENAAIDRLIDEAGYDLVLSNFLIQRISAKHLADKHSS